MVSFNISLSKVCTRKSNSNFNHWEHKFFWEVPNMFGYIMLWSYWWASVLSPVICAWGTPRLLVHTAGVSALGVWRVTWAVLPSRAWTPSHQPMYMWPPWGPHGSLLTYMDYTRIKDPTNVYQKVSLVIKYLHHPITLLSPHCEDLTHCASPTSADVRMLLRLLKYWTWRLRQSSSPSH